MQKQSVLTSFCIRGASNAFNSTFEQALNKKKVKKAMVTTDELARNYNVLNFVKMKQTERLQYYVAQEQLKSIRQQELKKEEGQRKTSAADIEEDIRKFKLLEEKIIEKPKRAQRCLQNNRKQEIITKQIMRLFPNQDINKKIQQSQKALVVFKSIRQQQSHNLFSNLNQKVIFFKSKLIGQLQSQSLRLQIATNSSISICEFTYNLKQISEQTQTTISLYIQNLFLKLLEKIRLSEILHKGKITKKWDSSLLLREENDLIKKKIKGKMMYSIQEEVYRLKDRLRAHNLNKEYFIRQKRYGIHQNAIQKSNPAIQFDSKQKKIVDQPNEHQQMRHQAKLSSNCLRSEVQQQEKPKSKSQFIEYRSTKYREDKITNSNTQPMKIKRVNISNLQDLKNYMSNREEPKSKHKAMALNKVQQYILQHKKPSPLSIENIGQYAYRNQKQSKSRQVCNEGLNKVQKCLKYPIKIQSLQVYSPHQSSLCYHTDSISLKELSLRFIQDRLKYRENKVKIQYPFRFTPEEEEKTIKSLQILNCLGADVYCQPECNYQYWNEIDQIDVLSIGWMLELPIREVIDYYSQYITSTLTKK